MATIHQVRGLLLEEVLLHLLRRSGYKTVDSAGQDPTLRHGHSGIEVHGRGETHQIDAIADFFISQPFSYPQRLLVEAKFMGARCGLPIVRNAVGVLKDVGEYFVPGRGTSPAKHRYSYRYAIFSASGYSPQAERYAYAQDIYLIPLDGSPFFSPVLDAIENVLPEDFGSTTSNVNVNLADLRSETRRLLKAGNGNVHINNLAAPAVEKLSEILDASRKIDGALLAMLGNRFPVFLVPQSPEVFQNIQDEMQVRIFWDDKGWYLSPANGRRNQKLFSFDLPPEIFKLYDSQGALTPQQAVHIKEHLMSEFQAIYIADGRTRVLRFNLDQDWLNGVREGLESTKSTYGHKRKGGD